MERELDIKKVYIDTRFKTGDSKSNSDFFIDLPRQFNVPDNTVAYIDDIVIPVCWRTVDARNSSIYFSVSYDFQVWDLIASITHNNYDGFSFAAELQRAMRDAASGLSLTISVVYDYNSNVLTIWFSDDRPSKPDVMTLRLYSDDAIKSGEHGGVARAYPQSANALISLNKNFIITDVAQYVCYLDLHTTRNLYLISSALAAYDTVSNFGNDTIIKKIPVRGNFNDIIFDNASEGFDFLSVSRRTLRHIDFRLVDSYFNTVDMQNTHWSFSIVFQRTR